MSDTNLTSGPTAKTRKWREFEVDAELKDSWLDRLNAIDGIKVCGTCCGHADGVGMGLGGLPVPTVNFDLVDKDEAWAGTVARQLRMIGCVSDILVWGDAQLTVAELNEMFGMCVTFRSGALVNTVLRCNGEFQVSQAVAGPLDRIVIHVASTLPNVPGNEAKLDEWWEKTISALEALFFKG